MCVFVFVYAYVLCMYMCVSVDVIMYVYTFLCALYIGIKELCTMYCVSIKYMWLNVYAYLYVCVDAFVYVFVCAFVCMCIHVYESLNTYSNITFNVCFPYWYEQDSLTGKWQAARCIGMVSMA